MTENKWTDEQHDAFSARNGSILVSAAAGSGKTAVLVERVVERVCDTKKPCPVDELLVVTFTQAAAAEMKDRISSRLSDELSVNPDNRFLLRQKLMLPSAEICTIDKFCLKTVKANYNKLGISPDFRILDNNEKDLLVKNAADIVLEQLYEENTDEFKALTEMFISGRTDDRLTEVIYKLYNNACAYAFPKEWVNSAVNLYNPSLLPQESPWGQKILKDIMTQLRYFVSALGKCLALLDDEPPLAEKYRPAFLSDISYYQAVYHYAKSGDWDNVKILVDGFKPERLGSAPKEYTGSYIKEYVVEVRDNQKSAFKKLCDEICVSTAEYREDTEQLKKVVVKLFNAVEMFSEEYAKLKETANAYDFSDVSHMALHLLVKKNKSGSAVKTELAKDLSKKYREILIDEYQDTNRAQDMLFSALSNDEDNLFVVGDVKQSIYGFRLAMPEIFVEKRSKLSDYSGSNYPAKITLDMNFRSRKGVTDCINYIFSRIMSEDMGGVDYGEGEMLKAKDDYEKPSFPTAELHLVDKSEIETESDVPEAVHIAETIKEIIESKMPVKTKNGYRPIKYNDICVLMRSTTKADAYYSAMKDIGIPVFFQKRGGFFGNTEVNVILSFLCVIDNPLQDVPLLSVLLSPIYGFTPDDLAEIRCENKGRYLFDLILNSKSEKCKSFINSYKEYKKLSTACTVDTLLRTIYDRSAYLSMVLSMEDGETRRLNLLLLVNYASDYEKNLGTGLSGFIRFISRIRDNKSDIDSATGISEYADVVKIMSIHASKGLEFPVVIIAGCGNQFNKQSQYDSLLIDPTTKLGVGTKRYFNDSGRVFETVQHYACRLTIRDSERAEELRIMYVAMTRARERLILVGSSINVAKKIEKCALNIDDSDIVSPSVIKNANSFLDIIITCLLGHSEAIKLRTYAKMNEPIVKSIDFPLEIKIISSLKETSEVENDSDAIPFNENIIKDIEEKTTYSYKYNYLVDCVAKISASSVNRLTGGTDFYITSKPAFLCKNDMTPALRGTATHKFLEICDMKNCESSVEDEITRLENFGKLSEAEADAVNRKNVSEFFNSNIYERIKNSDSVFKEQKFTISLPVDIPKETNVDLSREKTIVQGIIDCAFVENGEVVVLDYKTDNVKDESELKERYLGQLGIYKRAAEEIFGLKVKETLLFSLHLNKTIILDV